MAATAAALLRASVSNPMRGKTSSWPRTAAVCALTRPFSAAPPQYTGPFDSSYSTPPASFGMQWADKIHLRGLVFHGFHGAVPEENVYGQKFIVDATLYCSLRAAGTSDRLEDSVSYADVFRSIKATMEGPFHMLLESLAERLAKEVLSTYPTIQGITIHIKKPQVHLEGVMDTVGIEMSRFREGALLPPSASVPP